MLSYLHAFHAGNFADVQKHAALTLALAMMQAKKTPIACFDTHAGSALYDLDSERARKTAEADSGIQRVWSVRERLVSDDWQAMLAPLRDLNGNRERVQRYPGSPEWFLRGRRPQDSFTAFELHPSEGDRLDDWARSGAVRVRREDGLQGLLRCLPPAEPRLLVLTDPSYEIKSDYADVALTVQRAWQKCRHGVYLIWYPLLTSGVHQALLDGIRGGPVRKVWRNEVMLDTPPERGMVGSGMLVVNPPWGFDQRLDAMMAEVCRPGCLDASVRSDWLVVE